MITINSNFSAKQRRTKTKLQSPSWISQKWMITIQASHSETTK